MAELFYKFLVIVSRYCGVWVFILFSRLVAVGFFLFFPVRVKNSVRFYRLAFPEKGTAYAIWCAFRQFLNFTNLFLDRYLLQNSKGLTYTSRGWEHLEQVLHQGSGCILLMSHMGNWEIAAQLMKQRQPDIRLLLYMGIRHKEQLERMQKEAIRNHGIQIIAQDSFQGSPFDALEAIRFLSSGGIVSMTGDILWHHNQRSVTVNFLDYPAKIPQAPYQLALVSQTPILIFFSFRSGFRSYEFTILPPLFVSANPRNQRHQAIQKAAQTYASTLEQMFRQHPLEWFHFQPFIVESFGAEDDRKKDKER